MRVRERHKREDDAERGASRVVPGRLICQPMKLNKRGPTPMKIIKLAAGIVAAALILGGVSAQAQDKAAQVKSFGDLKGMKIGVSAPGSSTNFFVIALIARDGVKPDQVSIIGVGTGLSAVAAMKKGEIDAIVNLDPVMTKLEQDGDIVILADSRTDEGNMKLFGGNNPAAAVYLKTGFIGRNPVTAVHLVHP